LEFFYLDDFGVEGVIHIQGFLNLMGDPADAPSLNFNGNRMVDTGTIFEDYAYAISVFGFHGLVNFASDVLHLDQFAE